MNTKGHPWWKPKLDRKITSSGGSQMQDVWIRYNLVDAVDKKQMREILTLGYERVLIGVSRKNNMIIETLNGQAQKIKNIIEVVNG